MALGTWGKEAGTKRKPKRVILKKQLLKNSGLKGEQARRRKSNSIRKKDLEAKQDVMRSNVKPNELIVSIGKEGPANKYLALRKASFSKGGRAKHNIGGRANLLEEMGRIDARRHPDAADRAEKRRVIGELNKGYKSGGVVLKGKKVGCQIK